MFKRGALILSGLIILLLAAAGTVEAKSGFTGVNCDFCHGKPANDVFKAVHKFDGISTPATTKSCGYCHTNLTTNFFPLTSDGMFYNSTHRFNDTTLASRLLKPPACGNCHVDIMQGNFEMASGPEKYLTSSVCKDCHRKKYDDWFGTLHRVMLTNATQAKIMNLPLPPGLTWADISFMIVGKKSFRYLNESGYFSYSYDVANETFSPLNASQYTCGKCHTTGFSMDGNQDGLPGIAGTWNETGIACERCHGPAGNGHKVEVNASGDLCIECHSGSPSRFNTEAWKSSEHAPPMDAPARCTLCHSPFDYYKNNTVTGTDALNVPCATCHNPHGISDPQYEKLLSTDGFNASKMADVKEPVLSYFNANASRISLEGGETSSLTAGNDIYDVLESPAAIFSGLDDSYPDHINVTGPVSEVLCSKCHYNHGLGGVGGVNLTHARLNYPGLGLEPATCTDCHMSGTQKNHSFNVKDEMNFPAKTCSRGTECHVTSDQNLNKSVHSIVSVVNEWKMSGHNNSGFAAEGEPENTSKCAQCHSPMNWDPLNASETIPAEEYEGVTCGICHNIHDMGDWLKNTGKPYAWFKKDAINRTSYYLAKYSMESTTTGLCTNCHQNRPDSSEPGWKGKGPHKSVVPHTSAQGDMFNGSVKETDQNFECADCHMFIKKTDPENMTEQVLPDDMKITGHTFRMDVKGLQESGRIDNLSCSDCHSDGSSTGNLSSRIDSVQSDIKEKWKSANETVENVWKIYDTFTGEKTVSGNKLAEAFFDLYMVRNDRSWGVHNPQKAKDLLNDSLRLASEASASMMPTNVTANIISTLPSTNTVTNIEGELRTFIITTNREMNVTWYINGTPVQSNENVTTSTYINDSAAAGVWNVTSVAENDNGISMQQWDWTVNAAQPVMIEIMNFAFDPSNITIQKGMSVIWKNNDSVQHTVTSDDGIFDSGNLNPGETFKRKFNEVGNFSYHCSIHPSMKGTVMVIPAPAITPPQIDETMIDLELVADNLTAPVALVSPEDGTGRRFIADQIGKIWILSGDGEILKEPFMDISSKIVDLKQQYDERGLLGLAFHPNFSENGRFFIYYSAPQREGAPAGWDHTSTISEFKVMQNDSNRSDMSSEKIILQVDKPQSNHNAGKIVFGPDGYLYIPIGDGGGANDEGLGHPQPGNGQNTSSLLGKILRIDVDNGSPYGIPQDNPFVGKDGLDEIFAYGFRNPFHISFDAKGNHSLFASDAGQNAWEEVDMVTKGNNYGWNIREGTHCFDPNNPSLSTDSCPNVDENGRKLKDPIIEYANAKQTGGIGIVVTGGFIYRGDTIPQLNGAYIFGDLSKGFAEGDGSLLAARSDGKKMWSVKELKVASNPGGRVGEFVRSFGQDENNEIYVLTSEKLGPVNNTGKVFMIKPAFVGVKITSFDPKSSKVTDVVGGPTRTFTININQMANISWKINGMEVLSEENVDNSSYSNDSAVKGEWNVTVIAQNQNGSDEHDWVWKVTEPVTGNGSISGMKFNDSNGDGRKNRGEDGLKDWTIVLKNSNGDIVDTAVTNVDGKYVFSQVAPGNYTVEETLQEGWKQTFPDAPGIYNVTLEDGEKIKGIDFGNNLIPSGITATREIKAESIRLGESTTITIKIRSNVDQSLVLQEGIPEGWNFTKISDNADGFKKSTMEWAWFNVTEGIVKYSITAPKDANIGTYYINGTITTPDGEISIVGGDTMITLDIFAYYRGLGRDPDMLETRDLLRAMEDWRKGTKPPGFARPINIQELGELIKEWAMD